jgi:hypothetical protein
VWPVGGHQHGRDEERRWLGGPGGGGRGALRLQIPPRPVTTTHAPSHQRRCCASSKAIDAKKRTVQAASTSVRAAKGVGQLVVPRRVGPANQETAHSGQRPRRDGAEASREPSHGSMCMHSYLIAQRQVQQQKRGGRGTGTTAAQPPCVAPASESAAALSQPIHANVDPRRSRRPGDSVHRARRWVPCAQPCQGL